MSSAASFNKIVRDKMTTIERNIIINQFLPIIKYMARRYPSRDVEYNELVSTGVLALVRSLHRYDPLKGASIRTYARKCIKGAMIEEKRKYDKYPRYGRRPLEDIPESHKIKWRTKGLQEIVILDLDSTVSKGDETVYYRDIIPDKQPSVLQDIVDQERNTILSAVMDTLTPRERTVIRLYYFDNIKMKDISVTLGVSEGRVSQIHKCILKKMKQNTLMEGIA